MTRLLFRCAFSFFLSFFLSSQVCGDISIMAVARRVATHRRFGGRRARSIRRTVRPGPYSRRRVRPRGGQQQSSGGSVAGHRWRLGAASDRTPRHVAVARLCCCSIIHGGSTRIGHCAPSRGSFSFHQRRLGGWHYGHGRWQWPH